MPAQSILIYSAFHGVIGHSIQPLFGLVCADVNEGTTTVGVANHLIVHWNTGVILEDVDKFRILLRPGWVLVMNCLQLLLEHPSLKESNVNSITRAYITLPTRLLR